MAAPKRNRTEIVRDRNEIVRLYLREQKSQYEIVAILNGRQDAGYQVSQQMVSYDLCAIRKSWQKSALVDFDDAKAKELAKIDNLELEYWRAWIRSCEDAETATKKTKGVVQQINDEKARIIKQQPIEGITTTKGQAGDPRFLTGIQWCIERRCKILGIDAAQKVDMTTKGDKIIVLGVDLGEL